MIAEELTGVKQEPMGDDSMLLDAADLEAEPNFDLVDLEPEPNLDTVDRNHS